MKHSSSTITLLTALAAFTLFVFPVAAQQAGTKTAHAEDEAAIRENVKQMETGWNAKSGSLFAKPFAEDADYVVINGTYVQGREAIERGHSQIFSTIYKNTTVSLKVKQIRFLRPDVAVVHVAARRDAAEHEHGLETNALVSLTMTKDKQGWQIAAFQNTRVDNPQR